MFWRMAWMAVVGSCGVLRAADIPLAIPEGVLISSGLNTTFVAQFALFVSIVLLWSVIAGKLLNQWLKLPIIAGQIIGGLMLGPSLFNIRSWSFFAAPTCFIDHASGKLYALLSSDLFIFVIVLISAALTVSYLLWIAGHETDIRDMMKVGVAAVSAGFLGAVLPILMAVGGICLVLPFYFTMTQALSIGLILSATSVTIPVAMLFSKNMMHLKSSKATLGAAIIDDILAVILLSLFFIGVQAGLFGQNEYTTNVGHSSSLSLAFLYMIVSFALLLAVGYYLVRPIIRWLGARHRQYLIPSVANGMMLIYFAFAELIGGLAGITGAYFAGFFHRMGDKQHHAERVISPFANTVLLPLFLGSIGLQVDISVLTAWQWLVVGLILVIAVLSKMLACFIAMWLSNAFAYTNHVSWSWLDGYLFGASMIARGEVGLVVATILYGSGFLPQDQYVIAIVVIVLTTIASPIMLAFGLSAMTASHQKEDQEFILKLGFFKQIGTTQMFNSLVAYAEEFQTHMAVTFSQGRRIVTLEGERVKLILCPQEGIILEGDKGKIREILAGVYKAVKVDSEGLQPPALQE